MAINADKSIEADRIDITSIINDVWRSIINRWIIMLLTMLLAAVAVSLYAFINYEPIYKSSATFVVNSSSDATGGGMTERVANTFPYIIQNDALQQIIADDLGASEVPGQIYTQRIGETNMIVLTVDSNNAENAYAIVNSILENYEDVAGPVLGRTELTLLDSSGIPMEPINKRSYIGSGIKGALAAFLIWIIGFTVHSMLKKTIRSEEELKRFLSLKCLSTIPYVKKDKKKEKLAEKGDIFTERIRSLRTRIERDYAENGASVYMITSALAGEGKTTVSVNLALSLAAKGFKVIIVDLDLRKPSVGKTISKFSDDNADFESDGISEFLRGNIKVEDVLMRLPRSGLYYMPSGRKKLNVVRAVNNERLELLFNQLRSMADYVIIDTPPSSQVSDAAALVKHADGGIFVIRQDYSPLEYITDGIGLLNDTGLRLAGCVLNMSKHGIMDIASGYGYGYGYGYGKTNEK